MPLACQLGRASFGVGVIGAADHVRCVRSCPRAEWKNSGGSARREEEVEEEGRRRWSRCRVRSVCYPFEKSRADSVGFTRLSGVTCDG